MNIDDTELDILDTISDLDPNKVFTPPKIANEILDLLPNTIWKNKEIRILDPVSKSGIFLRESARRLMDGLKEEIPDETKRRKHILNNNLFGIATEYTCSLISRRTLYYSKDPSSKFSVVKMSDTKGNIFFKRTDHVFFAGKCQVCGGKESLEKNDNSENFAYPFIHDDEIMENMNFDVVVGNPPYQLEDDGNNRSATIIYHHFVKQALKLNPRYVAMIIGSRWFAGGKGQGLTDFRKELIQDKRIAKLVDYENAKEVFPTVGIDGGVCYFLWDKNFKGVTEIVNKSGKSESISKRFMDEFGDIFIRWNEALTILNKVLEKNKENKYLNSIVSPRMPFGLPTNFNDFDKKGPGSYKVYGLAKKEDYIAKNKITKGHGYIKKYKVLVSYVKGISTYPDDIILKPFIAKPNEVCKEQYLVVDSFETEREAENFISYLDTKLVRFLIAIRKISKHNTSEVWSFVPYPNLDIKYSDEMLYKSYKINNTEKSFIESKISSFSE
jgi:site-specific DNA-methyltransferase (adenine-specific)